MAHWMAATAHTVSCLTPSCSFQDAWDFLRDFTKKEFQGKASAFVATPQKRADLRAALVVSQLYIGRCLSIGLAVPY
jgi:hypothetical protein